MDSLARSAATLRRLTGAYETRRCSFKRQLRRMFTIVSPRYRQIVGYHRFNRLSWTKEVPRKHCWPHRRCNLVDEISQREEVSTFKIFFANGSRGNTKTSLKRAKQMLRPFHFSKKIRRKAEKGER